MTPTLWAAAFWKATAERSIKTAAQTALVTIGADRLNVLTADWGAISSMSAGGAVLSILMSIASDAATGGGPSLTGAERVDVGEDGDLP